MNRLISTALAGTLVALVFGPHPPASAQPAKGAPAAFERVREVMTNRLRDLKLTGDPDKDFAALLAAQQESLVFLSKTQLDYGGDRQLRESAQAISVDGQKRIDDLKQWQVRSAQADYKAQPDQPPPGSGPLDRQAQASPAPQPPMPAMAAPAQPSSQPSPAKPLPMVKGKVEEVDQAGGKVTLEHDAIPNLNMDGMTMPWRVQDPAVLKSLRKGDRIQFTADRVNGQLMVTKIQKGR
jgi:Cu/Ag efflux protein CusF